MRFLILGLLLLVALPVLSQDKIGLKNDREGKTFYQKRSHRKAQERALKAVSSQDILNTFTALVAATPENKLCSFELNQKLTTVLKLENPKFKELEGALYHLRSKNEIDDVSLKILVRAHEVENTELYLPKYEDDLWLPSDNAKVSEMLKAIGSAGEKLKSACLEEVYRNIYNEILKVDKKTKDYHVEALLVEAYKMKMIDYPTYVALEKARINSLEKITLDLKSYYKKVKSIRTHFPLRDPTEKSDFVSEKLNRKGSRRQRLLEQYSDLQIMLMGDVVKKLRARLESPKVEILVYAKEEDRVDETIILEPMERFRFAIKVLRKEMDHLALNTYFNGVAPDYTDLLSAAYETGIIPAVEMQEIAGLEEIWSPKKTFWEKARFWVQTFGTSLAIVIPPPYGFVPALALVVIEATAGKKKDNDDNTSLF